MAKPWARLEQNYINHPKFLALSANAICLWHEGKNYCDMHQTDGLIPREALRTFRFTSTKAVVLLTRSCGLKPAGQAYAPLWEAFELGGAMHFKMHDYLDHNDCRDEVLQRLEDADDRTELRRLQNRDRQRLARVARKAELAALRHAPVSVTSREKERDGTRDPLTPTETETETHKKERERGRAGGLEDEGLSLRAGRLVERYGELFSELRHGAKYHPRPTLDWQDACGLCRTWADDQRLEKLARIVLMTDDKFITKTDRSFHIFALKASWADDRLRQIEGA